MNKLLHLQAMLEWERMKTAFDTNAFSGPMNPNIQSGASYLPPGKAPSLRTAIQAKTAASAPTRGNFMQASDIPPLKVPGLRTAIEKSGDMLPDYVTYNQGDFKPAKLNEKAKLGALSPVTQAAQSAKSVGSFKPGKLPGPSIADIAKPKGAGFGTGIPGAFKPSTGIGGNGPVNLAASPGSLK